MQEAGVLVDAQGKPIYWHVPANRTTSYLPDSRDLWEVIWENRHTLYGYAHSHPGSGVPGASTEDITTFSAVEKGIGRRLVWWITSSTDVTHYLWRGPQNHDYRSHVDLLVPHGFSWLEELRSLSHYNGV